MSQLIAYQKMSSADLKKRAQEEIGRIKKWFQNHPERQECNIELWYGKIKKVTRENAVHIINQVLEESIEKK